VGTPSILTVEPAAGLHWGRGGDSELQEPAFPHGMPSDQSSPRAGPGEELGIDSPSRGGKRQPLPFVTATAHRRSQAELIRWHTLEQDLPRCTANKDASLEKPLPWESALHKALENPLGHPGHREVRALCPVEARHRSRFNEGGLGCQKSWGSSRHLLPSIPPSLHPSIPCDLARQGPPLSPETGMGLGLGLG
jgi:hypothetical protein